MIERLKLEMAKRKINARELAERANVGSSFVYDILRNKSSNPTTKKMGCIAEALGVSLPYLISGFHDDPKDYSLYDDIIAIPVLSNAGRASRLHTLNKNYMFDTKWIKGSLGVSPDDTRIWVVDSDSMYPTFHSGDAVLVDTSCKSPGKPGIFVIISGEAMVARRMEFIPEKNLKMVAISADNNHFVPYTCHVEKVDILGKIVWVSRSLGG